MDVLSSSVSLINPRLEFDADTLNHKHLSLQSTVSQVASEALEASKSLACSSKISFKEWAVPFEINKMTLEPKDKIIATSFIAFACISAILGFVPGVLIGGLGLCLYMGARTFQDANKQAVYTPFLDIDTEDHKEVEDMSLQPQELIQNEISDGDFFAVLEHQPDATILKD